MSGDSIERQKENYQNIQIADFLRKPVVKNDILSAIHKILN